MNLHVRRTQINFLKYVFVIGLHNKHHFFSSSMLQGQLLPVPIYDYTTLIAFLSLNLKRCTGNRSVTINYIVPCLLNEHLFVKHEKCHMPFLNVRYIIS